VISNGSCLRIFTAFAALIALCACATTPQHHAYSDTSGLALGKTTVSEARSVYGEPTENDIQNGADGKVETFRYVQMAERWGKGCGRLLDLEFKDGVLNGYVFGSSFAEDKTSFAITNVAKIEWAASTKEEVAQLLGQPQGRIHCPTRLFGGSRCKITGREIWVYVNFDPVPLLTPGRVKRVLVGDICTITFDQHGLVTDISKTQGGAF
jgi:hypothetical protein